MGQTITDESVTLQITKITQNSRAHRLNLLPFIHTITLVNEKTVGSSEDVKKEFIKWKQHNIKLQVLDLCTQKIKDLELEKCVEGESLGINVKVHKGEPYCPTLCLVEIDEDSPAYRAGLRVFEDYVIGIEGVYIPNEDAFRRRLYGFIGRECVLFVFNRETNTIRRVTVVLNDDPENLMGAELGTGLLYKIFDESDEAIRLVFDDEEYCRILEKKKREEEETSKEKNIKTRNESVVDEKRGDYNEKEGESVAVISEKEVNEEKTDERVNDVTAEKKKEEVFEKIEKIKINDEEIEKANGVKIEEKNDEQKRIEEENERKANALRKLEEVRKAKEIKKNEEMAMKQREEEKRREEERLEKENERRREEKEERQREEERKRKEEQRRREEERKRKEEEKRKEEQKLQEERKTKEEDEKRRLEEQKKAKADEIKKLEEQKRIEELKRAERIKAEEGKRLEEQQRKEKLEQEKKIKTDELRKLKKKKKREELKNAERINAEEMRRLDDLKTKDELEKQTKTKTEELRKLGEQENLEKIKDGEVERRAEDAVGGGANDGSDSIKEEMVEPKKCDDIKGAFDPESDFEEIDLEETQEYTIIKSSSSPHIVNHDGSIKERSISDPNNFDNVSDTVYDDGESLVYKDGSGFDLELKERLGDKGIEESNGSDAKLRKD
ncbi:Golgi reassembly stacking protein GRASP65 [Trachipleistophora hominis]|uniref:Golgi reassembly stacking protein GRASP65 n=1 Tax=Trachipleistophora hominis TaxID=72359 RepID=L7JW48_TRAHO|nr:Golgi reassembly stacking protein GRASP65 [Trachipleistophora hominis]